MKSYNNLYEPMLHDDYIRQNFNDAARHKKNKKTKQEIKKALENIDKESGIVQDMMQKELFIPSHHTPRTINENTSKKNREILAGLPIRTSHTSYGDRKIFTDRHAWAI